MRVMSSVRMVIASALIVAMPVQVVSAATRPSVAVPTASVMIAADNDACDIRDRVDGRDRLCGARAGWAWPAIGVIISAIVLAIVLESHNGRGRGTGFSR